MVPLLCAAIFLFPRDLKIAYSFYWLLYVFIFKALSTLVSSSQFCVKRYFSTKIIKVFEALRNQFIDVFNSFGISSFF